MTRPGSPLTEEMAEAAESIFDGWFADDSRIDWDQFIDRLERSTDVDFGEDMGSPLIRAVQKHIRAYRKL